MQQSIFLGADLSGADARKANMYQANFKNAKCERTCFAGAELTYAEFLHTDISAADFSGASLFRTRFHRTKEDGVTFTNRSLALGDDETLAEAEDFRPNA